MPAALGARSGGPTGRSGERKVTPRRPPPFPARALGGRGSAGVGGFGPWGSGPAWPPRPLCPPPVPGGHAVVAARSMGAYSTPFPHPVLSFLLSFRLLLLCRPYPRQQNFFVDSETSRKMPRQVTAECSGLSPAEEPRSRRPCSQITCSLDGEEERPTGLLGGGRLPRILLFW